MSAEVAEVPAGEAMIPAGLSSSRWVASACPPFIVREVAEVDHATRALSSLEAGEGGYHLRR